MSSRTIFVGSVRALAVINGPAVHKLSVPEDTNEISLGFGAAAQPTIYATSEQGVFVSTDGGATWSKSTLPGDGGRVRAIATSLHHPEVAYVSYDHLRLDGKNWMGVAKTTDSGKTWDLVWKESWADEEEGSGIGGNAGVAPKNIHDAWITERFGPAWGENPLAMTVADQDPNLAYGTDLGRTMRTR